MLKKGFIGLVLAVFLASPAAADEFIYKSKNKLDFVKLDQAKKKEKEGGLLHPHDFDPDQIRVILASIHFNKKILMMKDIENRRLFDDGNVETLAPYLIEAFKKAKPEETVVVSYFTRDQKFLIQNDRLTIFRAFVKEDGLHLIFTKVYAKLLGDRMTMGADKISREARSIRVGLEVQPGQNRLSWDPEELVFDLAYYAPGGVKEAQPVAEKAIKIEKKGKGKEAAAAPAQEGEKTVRERLKELDDLKKDELITEKEYQRKRRELIEQL